MDDQKMPNLEEMDEQEARQFLTELYTVLSPEKEYEIRHEDLPCPSELVGTLLLHTRGSER